MWGSGRSCLFSELIGAELRFGVWDHLFGYAMGKRIFEKGYHSMRLAVIAGDGIGPEVTAEALKVLHAVRDDVDMTDFHLGADRYLETGDTLTDEDLAALREHDVILLGAIGDPRKVAAGVLERALLLKLRFALDHHVNLRPSKLYPTSSSPLAIPVRLISWWFAKVPKGCIAATGACCVKALRMR